MQKCDGNDDIRRVRFHASTITTNKTPEGTEFRDVPDVKVLYITEYDALKNNQLITQVKRCQKIGDQDCFSDPEFLAVSNAIRYYKETDEGRTEMKSVSEQWLEEGAELERKNTQREKERADAAEESLKQMKEEIRKLREELEKLKKNQ